MTEQGGSNNQHNEDLDEEYAVLVHESLQNRDSSCGLALLLPAVLQPANTENSDSTDLRASVKRISGERDAALDTVRLLRNKVENLHGKNRELYYEMNKKIETVRDFWRNQLVEGGSRSGLCVKLAVQNTKCNQT